MLPKKKNQNQHKNNLHLSCILKVNGQGRKKTFPPHQGAFTVVRGKISRVPATSGRAERAKLQPAAAATLTG